MAELLVSRILALLIFEVTYILMMPMPWYSDTAWQADACDGLDPGQWEAWGILV